MSDWYNLRILSRILVHCRFQLSLENHRNIELTIILELLLELPRLRPRSILVDNANKIFPWLSLAIALVPSWYLFTVASTLTLTRPSAGCCHLGAMPICYVWFGRTNWNSCKIEIAELTMSWGKVCWFSNVNSFLIRHNCHQIIATFSRKFYVNCSLWLTNHSPAHKATPCQAHFKSISNTFQTFLVSAHWNNKWTSVSATEWHIRQVMSLWEIVDQKAPCKSEVRSKLKMAKKGFQHVQQTDVCNFFQSK